VWIITLCIRNCVSFVFCVLCCFMVLWGIMRFEKEEVFQAFLNVPFFFSASSLDVCFNVCFRFAWQFECSSG
jgi:hypothetical protein